MKDSITWDGEVDVPGLRLYVAEAFDWTSKIGAIKFVRGLAPALLIHKLRLRGDRRDSGYGDLILTAMNEMELVRAIAGKRTHITSDGIPELRVIYHPMDIVGIDLDEEPDDSGDYGRDGLAPVLDDDQIEAYQSDAEISRPGPDSPKKRGPSVYDPTEPDKAWIPETIAKVGIPLKVEDYEESLRNPRKLLTAKALAKKAQKKKGGMPKGAMDKFVSVSKPGKERAPSKSTRASSQDLSPSETTAILENTDRNVQWLVDYEPGSGKSPPRGSARSSTENLPIPASKPKPKGKSRAALKEKPTPNANPWTLSQTRPSSSQPTPRTTKPNSQPQKQTQVFDLSSSSPPQPISTPLKHRYSPSPSRDRCMQTPSRKDKDPDTPSLRKKRTPESDSHRVSSDLPPVTRRLDFTPQRERSESPDDEFPTLSQTLGPASQTSQSSSKPTGEAESERERSESPENEFPTLQQMMAPASQFSFSNPPSNPTSSSSPQVITLDSSPPVSRTMAPPQKTEQSKLEKKAEGKEGKKYIMLRDSLPGGWKMVDETDEVGGVREGARGKGRGKEKKWRMSEVQVLDLTGD